MGGRSRVGSDRPFVSATSQPASRHTPWPTLHVRANSRRVRCAEVGPMAETAGHVPALRPHVSCIRPSACNYVESNQCLWQHAPDEFAGSRKPRLGVCRDGCAPVATLQGRDNRMRACDAGSEIAFIPLPKGPNRPFSFALSPLTKEADQAPLGSPVRPGGISCDTTSN